MKLSKNLTIILAILLLAVLAVGAASASEDIAIDDGADSIDDVVSVSEDADDVVEVVDEVAPVEEEVADSVDEEVEPSRDITYTNHQVDANNWSSFDFEQGNVVVDFEPGTYAYNIPNNRLGVDGQKGLLKSSILSDGTLSNNFLNPDFDDGTTYWELSNEAITTNVDEQGNYLYVPFVEASSGSMYSIDFYVSQEISLYNVEEIRFLAKTSVGQVWLQVFIDSSEGYDYIVYHNTTFQSNGEWKEIVIPGTQSSPFFSFTQYATDTVSHKVIFKIALQTHTDSNRYFGLDSVRTISPTPVKTETTLTVVEDGNNLAVTFKDVEGNAVAGDVKVYNGEELIGTLTFDGENTTKTIAKPSVAGGSTVTITAKFEGNEAYAASTSEPISYVAPYNADDIQELFDNVEEGGVINLIAGAIYDVGSTQFTLTNKVTINGNGATIIASGAAQGGEGAVIIAKAAGTTFKDIIFKNSDGHKEYGEGVAGYAIELAIENGTVDNCTFLDWSSGIYGKGAAFCTIMNSYFNGSSDLVTGAGKGEKGTKAINLMGSHDITVKGCTFEGQVLDGISIASNSGHNIMTDNTFIDNVYAIYFGGASTQGCVIANNTFIRCGYCPNVTDDINKKVTVLSTQKACNGFIIADNVIEALSGTTFISMESGNTAHGYPSTIGDINVTGNTLALAEGAVAQTVTFVKIVSNSGELSPYAPINISGNDLADGVTPVKVWYADWGSEDNPTIPAADPVVTSFEIVDVSTANKKLTVKLVDIGGEALAGETISYSINGAAAKTAETDEDGLVTIDVTENGVVAIAFEGNDNYQAAETSINFAATAQRTTPTITASAMSAYAKIGKYYTVTLKDASGNAIVGQTVKFIFNGKTTNVKTDENGKAKIKLTVATKGTYPITVSFLGNDKYNAVVAVKNIKVVVQKTKATFAKKTFKVKATKKLTFTLKDSKGKAIAGKKITFKVNKKTYTAKTNKKGIATVKVKLTKKGKYTATATFAGDNTYKKISKKAAITVK